MRSYQHWQSELGQPIMSCSPFKYQHSVIHQRQAGSARNDGAPLKSIFFLQWTNLIGWSLSFPSHHHDRYPFLLVQLKMDWKHLITFFFLYNREQLFTQTGVFVVEVISPITGFLWHKNNYHSWHGVSLGSLSCSFLGIKQSCSFTLWSSLSL